MVVTTTKVGVYIQIEQIVCDLGSMDHRNSLTVILRDVIPIMRVEIIYVEGSQ